MTDNELKRILDAIKYVPDERERDEVTSLILKAASESITLERLKTLTAKEERKAQANSNGDGRYIEFTRKEINAMPESIKRLFTINDKLVTYRITQDGYYQARYRSDGYRIEVAAKDFETMKRRFLSKFAEAVSERENNKYPLFSDFVQDWLKVKKQTIKETTYSSYEMMTVKHLLPRFGKMRVNEITRQHIQNFLFEKTEKGNNRTAQKLKQMLSAIFDVIHEDYNIKSPMNKVVLAHYEVKKGKALTLAEEKQLIDFCSTNSDKYSVSALLVLLYTGMRVGELTTLEYDGTYISCRSEKTRKGHAEVIRKIPVSPMLKRVLHLIDFDKAKAVQRYGLRSAMKNLFPERHVHELRYTFITRAKECGISGEVVMKWVGHEYDSDVKTSRVDRGYTDYSQEFMLKEISKFDYKL